MLQEAIQKIVDLAKLEVAVVNLNDKQYVSKAVFNPPAPEKEQVVAPLHVSTLGGFIDFVKTKVASADHAKYLIHVEDFHTVRLLSDPFGPHKQREQLIWAQPEELFSGGFKFNNFVPHSTFMIAIQTLFLEKQFDWQKVVDVISNIREEQVKQSQDNGLAQTVTARVNVAIADAVEVPRTVTLAPYRTFREIQQPHSQFVLRLTAKPGELPQVGLFEADGGMWKNDAIENIMAYLQEHFGPDYGVPIIA